MNTTASDSEPRHTTSAVKAPFRCTSKLVATHLIVNTTSQVSTTSHISSNPKSRSLLSFASDTLLSEYFAFNSAA
ncbi:hypothetical protein VNO78_08921 [Psophocarpus tetragonolobus]|uniref:Uncharacterized protein n=1 Tax=Psophocarpus tetragonolobus TaxID=3891 RepID=A0AAN9SYQ3_PSOTE